MAHSWREQRSNELYQLWGKIRWHEKAPQPFDHGVSLADATHQQLEWMRAETERCLRSGAWVLAKRRRHVSRIFLVLRPGTNKWRLVMDFRWLNAHCVKSQCKMETLKKLRRLAKPDDWCFSFDLQNGHHAVGIHPEYQEYMEFDVRGELFQCGALPFGWNDSLRIFVEVMKVLVECCVPQRIEGRLQEHQQRAHVLPYTDDFLVLASSDMEALRARELASRTLTQLGLGRNEKKGQWEPTQLVEHLGLEVDLKAGQFRVTPATGSEPEERAQDLAQPNPGEASHGLLPVRVGEGGESLLQQPGGGGNSYPLHLEEPEADVADEAPNLNDIELQARYIRSEANEWADRLSRDRDLDDWRLNRRWFRWAEAEWHRHVVDWFASELSAQLPRYYAQWCDPGCEEVDSLAYSWQGDVTWVNPSWHLLGEVAHKLQEEGVQVYWPIDNAWYSGTVGSTTDGHIRVAYDDVDGIVRAYGGTADGGTAWRQLAKLRRNTNYAYFNRQVKELLSFSAQSSSLTPPLLLFLKVKDTFTRVREYVCVAPPLDTGHKMCVDTLEAIVVSVILISLHSDYVYVKTKFQSDRLPRLHVLEDEVCAHYDNIIAPGVASGDVGAGIAEDRKRQNAAKKARLGRKVECSTCHRRGHEAKDCFITNAEARESFLERRPDAKESIMKKVQEYEKHGKLPDTDKAGAVADSELHPGLDGEDVLFAISEVASPWSFEPALSHFPAVTLSEFIEVRGGAPRTTAGCRQSILDVPTSNYYLVLETPEDTEDCELRPAYCRAQLEQAARAVLLAMDTLLSLAISPYQDSDSTFGSGPGCEADVHIPGSLPTGYSGPVDALASPVRLW
ncbi:hypothetical protein CYMTET_47193 [Cymbomonas tetramitiformis]|uniref:Reverse transcriptase domain-containing protein n=1 Tax=Cymbomonas tetramitiformis TaxID=36881 RepID=A0AAE0BUN3_9CHLO|nr:hypothetical protein CYMTET_47193 [Cymbomonas tetramitiformis]